MIFASGRIAGDILLPFLFRFQLTLIAQVGPLASQGQSSDSSRDLSQLASIKNRKFNRNYKVGVIGFYQLFSMIKNKFTFNLLILCWIVSSFFSLPKSMNHRSLNTLNRLDSHWLENLHYTWFGYPINMGVPLKVKHNGPHKFVRLIDNILERIFLR